jgi:nuclear pore complex protein Nup205
MNFTKENRFTIKLLVPDDLWTPFKHFQSVIEAYLQPNPTETNITNLEQILRKHKQNFSTLLKNPVSIF